MKFERTKQCNQGGIVLGIFEGCIWKFKSWNEKCKIILSLLCWKEKKCFLCKGLFVNWKEIVQCVGKGMKMN